MYATHTAHSTLRLASKGPSNAEINMKLAVEISDAADLAPKDGAGSCNPFVEVEFDDQKQRIAAKPGDRSPYWNHTLLFDVRDPARLPSLPIDASVHHDRSLQDHHAVRPYTFLGRGRISGASVAPSPNEAVLQRPPWRPGAASAAPWSASPRSWPMRSSAASSSLRWRRST